MRYTLFYDERLKKKIKKLDNGTKVILKTWIEKHSVIKTIFSYEFYVDGEVVIIGTSSHNILGTDSDRAIRIDRNLPKWDQILKDVVGNEYKE